MPSAVAGAKLGVGRLRACLGFCWPAMAAGGPGGPACTAAPYGGRPAGPVGVGPLIGAVGSGWPPGPIGGPGGAPEGAPGGIPGAGPGGAPGGPGIDPGGGPPIGLCGMPGGPGGPACTAAPWGGNPAGPGAIN